MDERYADVLAAARRAAVLREHEFSSAVPFVGGLIARFRRAWNSVSTRYYVISVITQQMAFNQLSVDLLTQLGQGIERQEGALAAWVSQASRELQELRARVEASELREKELREELAQAQTWLIAQDRDQVALRHDLSELAVQLREAGSPK